MTDLPPLSEADAIHVASRLVGRTVRYINEEPSTVRDGGNPERTFVVEAVQAVWTTIKGVRVACLSVLDVDCGGEARYRTLILDRIEAVV